MNDWELLQAYCRNGSESAFETLVKRHVDFVYCSALRQVRDPLLAEDVSQAVFLLLVRKARSFRSGTVLVSWLFRTTQFVAARALRTEHRRQRRELEAANMNPQSTAPECKPDWERVTPVLDEALATLPGKDRDAVLLRFISRKPFSEVGAGIGVSEDAAKKRVNRALARLRQFFARRGTTLSAAAIVAILGERVVQAAPAELATKITAALGAGASAAASTSAAALLKTALRDLFWAKVKWGTVISVGVFGVLLFVSSTLRPVGNGATMQTADVPATRTAISVDSEPAASDDSGSKETHADRKLSLLVARAEDRQPVSGARVLVECYEGRNKQRVLDSATDSQGGLDIPIPTRAFSLLVWVSAEGRVPMVMRWQGHEFNEPVISHSLLLEAGNVAVGTVFDESGNPISGATVSFSGPGLDLGNRENRHFHPELSASVTGANGRWTTSQLPSPGAGSGVNIRVTHPDFVPTSPGVGGWAGFPTNAIIILSNGVALSGRVTAVDGSPIPNARVAKQSGSAYLSTQTDADGRFHWPHVEPGQVFVDVEAEGFETIHEFAWATNAANECAFTLKESSNPATAAAASDTRTRLHGSVVDAETRQPIPRFKVLIGNDDPFPRSGSEAVLTSPHFLGEGHDGRFDWQVLPQGGSFRLQVEAEGYLESVSEQRMAETADVEFEFKLKRGRILAGTVLTAGGLLAEGAEVTLAGKGFGPVMQRPGQMLHPNPGFETTRTRTDRHGKFTLKLKMGARGVAVIHESGCALLSFAAATNAPIVLAPWGVIEGTLFLSGKPAPKQHVSVNGRQESESDPMLLLSFGYRATTDDHGRFRFDHVPPGEHSIARLVGLFDDGPAIANHSHVALVRVESGTTASVELRGHGRLVIGRITFDGAPDDVQWGMSQASLQVEGTKPPQVDYERAPADSARAAFLHQAQTLIPFSLSKDGSIRADDVPPGNYILSVELAGASANPIQFSKPFGSIKMPVTVPPNDDENKPIDLGVLSIERVK